MSSIPTLPARRRRAHALVLSSGIAALTLGALLPAMAHAQDAPAAPVTTDDVPQTASESLTDDIVVNGRRQRTALNEEQQAIATIDIVTTGDVAIHSQTSIADLAKMLPGVSVSRDQGRNQSATGEAQFVTIRGFDTSYNAYTLDGLRLPQTSGNNRAISLNLFSPFAIGGIVTDKTRVRPRTPTASPASSTCARRPRSTSTRASPAPACWDRSPASRSTVNRKRSAGRSVSTPRAVSAATASSASMSRAITKSAATPRNRPRSRTTISRPAPTAAIRARTRTR
ncbi:TonB-dependent receptor plug domain-containing protein [Sphingomonas panni]